MGYKNLMVVDIMPDLDKVPEGEVKNKMKEVMKKMVDKRKHHVE